MVLPLPLFSFRRIKTQTALVVAARPLLRDGGMAEDYGALQARKLPRVWTRGRRETESRQRARAQTGIKGPKLVSAE